MVIFDERYNLWKPDGDRLVEMEGGVYQGKVLNLALNYVKDKRCYVDVGANIGTWVKYCRNLFNKVYAFEPYGEAFECLMRNVSGVGTYEYFPIALGKEEAELPFLTLNNSTSNYIHPTGKETVKVLPLDDFNLDPTFLKIDAEGYEPYVLQGAIETIKEHSPVICIEIKHEIRNGFEKGYCQNFLTDLGYKVMANIDEKDLILCRQ